MTIPWQTGLGLLLMLTSLAPAPATAGDGEGGEPQVGRSFRVPYLLTETNHFIVRARINDAGPFNLVVDTGAPALFLSEEAAEEAGVAPKKGRYFARSERIEFEGGAALDDVQTRVEDIFQLVGMNALGLPGVRIDGMLGFNALARYRITIDPTDDRMTWTRIDYEPPDLFDPGDAEAKPPAEVQAMEMLGGVAQLAAVFVGKQPEDELIPRGFLGIELREADGAVEVAAVLPGSPAERAGLEAGDRIIQIDGDRVRSIAEARVAVAEVEPGAEVRLRVRSEGDDEDRRITLTAGEGL